MKDVVGVEGEVAVDLAGRDVVEPGHVPAGGRPRARVWVPRTLVRKNSPGSRTARLLWDSAAKWTTVSIGVGPDRLEGGVAVTDVTVDERDPVLDVGQVGPVPGVGEGVVDDHVIVGMVLHPVADEVGTDETGATGHEQMHGAPS